ncbi:MAG: hypothetical protein WDN23_02335 [Edaphobacter sp.]
MGGAEDDLNEGGGRGRKLCSALGEEDEAGGIEPVAKHVEGEDWVGVMTPMNKTSGGELLCRGGGWAAQVDAFLPGETTAHSNLQPGLKG